MTDNLHLTILHTNDLHGRVHQLARITTLVIPDEQAEYEIPTVLPEVFEAYIQTHSPIREFRMGRIKFLDD